ncbi:MAG TPA: hypothetical protein VM327_10865 [Candidatus Thermoplasmatota archaeon]|nr:hypothetical protein [Candidatus Thermoplasmatota archaeon]
MAAAGRMAAVLCLALLAGCVQPAPPVFAEAVADDPPARVLDWHEAGCRSVTWSVPITGAALEPYLPAGFEPSPAEPSPGGPGAFGRSVGASALGFRAVECDYGFGDEKLLGSVQSGMLFASVLPPPDLREERFTAHYSYGWDLLVTSEGWRADARTWDLPLHDGGATVHPSAQGWTGSLAIDQVGSFSLSGRPVDSDRAVEDVETRTITLGSQGFALWDSEAINRTVSTGIGTWTVSPESWVAAVIGTTQGIATFEYSLYDLPSALVHWPGQALDPVE